MLASHTELGRARRCAIACVLEINDSNVHDSFRRFRNWIRQSGQPSVVELVELLAAATTSMALRVSWERTKQIPGPVQSPTCSPWPGV